MGEGGDVVSSSAIGKMIPPFVPSPFDRPLGRVFDPEFWVGSDFPYILCIEYGDVSGGGRYEGSRRGGNGGWTHASGEVRDGEVAVGVDVRGEWSRR